MAERRHGGRRGDARGGGRSGGRGDLPNEEAARQRDLRDIENDDLRQQVRDLQRDIEKGDLRRQVRDLQRRLASLEKRRGKSNPMRSIASERRSMDDPLFSDVFTSYDADEPSQNCNNDILSMPVYDTPVYDEDIYSMPVYDKPVYDEDIFYELPGLISESPPPFVKFDDVAENKGFAVYDDEEYDEAEGGNQPATENLVNAVVCDGVTMKSGVVLEVGAVLSSNVVIGQTFVVPAYNTSGNIEIKLVSNLQMQAAYEVGGAMVLTMRDLYKYQIFPKTLYSGWYNLAWAQVVNNKPLGDVFVTMEDGSNDNSNSYNNRVVINVEDGMMIDVVGEVLNGLRCYFNKVDSRTSLFQEGEYDAVLDQYKTWWLRKLLFWFYLFPS